MQCPKCPLNREHLDNCNKLHQVFQLFFFHDCSWLRSVKLSNFSVKVTALLQVYHIYFICFLGCLGIVKENVVHPKGSALQTHFMSSKYTQCFYGVFLYMKYCFTRTCQVVRISRILYQKLSKIRILHLVLITKCRIPPNTTLQRLQQ